MGDRQRTFFRWAKPTNRVTAICFSPKPTVFNTFLLVAIEEKPYRQGGNKVYDNGPYKGCGVSTMRMADVTHRPLDPNQSNHARHKDEARTLPPKTV